MNRSAVGLVVIVVLCVTSLVIAAGTLETAVHADQSPTGADSPPMDGPDDDVPEEEDDPDADGTFDTSNLCVPILTSPWVLGLLGLVIVAISAWLIRSYGVVLGLILVISFSVPLAGAYMIPATCEPPSPATIDDGGTGENATANETDAEFIEGAPLEPTNRPTVSVAALGVVLVLSMAGVLGYYFRSRRLQQIAPPTEAASTPAVDPEAVSRLVGEAADRIDAASDLENEVYRAWREMTDHLDVDRPESSTPGEFATAAVAAGFDADDIDELTSIFETVRYGDHSVTPTQELRAIECLRRLEDAHFSWASEQGTTGDEGSEQGTTGDEVDEQ
ncbi:DUF4129 domain-containing protein [Natrialbaceae archaeon A-CW1-1]